MNIRFSPAAAALLLALLPPAALAGPIVFEASGSNASAIQATVDAFRFALGSPNNGNNSGPLASGRREINWDGAPPGATATAKADPIFAGFKNSRGALFTTSGSGFEQAILDDIVDNPSYATTFSTFSPRRVFTPVGSNVTDATFFTPGSPSSAFVTAFGAVFSDVDLAGSTRVEFFGLGGGPLFSQFVLPGTTASGSLSFLGVQFDGGELITRARITTGNAALGPNDGGGVDLVVMDDLLYSEPQSVPEPGSLSLLAIGAAAVALARRKRVSIRPSR
jgi:hypothetical protein